MKKNYETRARKFVRDIQPYLKGLRINHSEEFHLLSKVAQFNHENHRKVEVRQGVSRYALITSDYVIKIDKRKECYWGTSKDEVLAYNKAKEFGMEHLLVKITPYTYRGRTYYIMPKVLLCKDNEKKTSQAWCNLSDEEKYFIQDNFYDQHDENTGIYKGQFVLLDYASNAFRGDN